MLTMVKKLKTVKISKPRTIQVVFRKKSVSLQREIHYKCYEKEFVFSVSKCYRVL